MNTSCVSLASVYSKSDYHLHDHHNVEQLNGRSQVLNLIRPQNYRRSNSSGYNNAKKKDKKDKILFSNLGTALLNSLGIKRRERVQKSTKKSVKQVKRAQSTIPSSTKNQLQKAKLFVDLINLNSDSQESSPLSTTSSSSAPDSSFTASTTRLNQLIGSIMNLSTLQIKNAAGNDNKSSAWNLPYDCKSESSSGCYNGGKNSKLNKEEFGKKMNYENIYTNIYNNVYNNLHKSDNNGLHERMKDGCENKKANFSASLNVDLNNYVINRDEYYERKSKRNDSLAKANDTIAKKKQLKLKIRQNNHQDRFADEKHNSNQQENNAYIDFNNFRGDNGIVKYNNCSIYDNKEDVVDKGYNVGTIYANVPHQMYSLSYNHVSRENNNEKPEKSVHHNGDTKESSENCAAKVLALVEEELSSTVCYSNNDLNVLVSSKKQLNELKLYNPPRHHSESTAQKQDICSVDFENCNQNKSTTKGNRPFSVASFQKMEEDVCEDTCFTHSHLDFSPPITFSSRKKLCKDSFKHYFKDDNVKLCRISKRIDTNDTTNNTNDNTNNTNDTQVNNWRNNFNDKNNVRSKRYIIKKYKLNKYLTTEESPETLKSANPLNTSHHNEPFNLLQTNPPSYKNQIFFL